MSGEAPAEKAVWKKPDDVCECIKWMEKNELMRWGETHSGPLMPVIDPHRRRRNASFAAIKFCPNCGEPTFTVVPAEGGSQ